jgi:hypothetical protein
MMVAGAVVLAIGNSCTKMTPAEVQQVEQQTGKKAEDLTEEELDTAMETLGIEGQEPTEQEVAALERRRQEPLRVSGFNHKTSRQVQLDGSFFSQWKSALPLNLARIMHLC